MNSTEFNLRFIAARRAAIELDFNHLNKMQLDAAMTTRVLDPSTCERIVKLLGMTGSAHDGEVANAARLADRLLRASGMCWADVIVCAPCAEQPQQDDDQDHRGFWGELIDELYSLRHRLSARDRAFIESMARWSGPVTAKQKKWLSDIWRRRP